MNKKKSDYWTQIHMQRQQEKDNRAIGHFQRNTVGLILSAILFLVVLLLTVNGFHAESNVMMMLIVLSMMGVFYFGRELRLLPLGQLIFSTVKALLCLSIALCYVILHEGYWDWMDYGILGILVGVVLIDIPRVYKSVKELRS